MMLLLPSLFSSFRFVVGCSDDIVVDNEDDDVVNDDDVGYGKFVDICWWRCLPHRKHFSLSTVAMALADKILPPLSFSRHCCCFVAVFVVVVFRCSSRLL